MTLSIAGYGLFQFANGGGFWPCYLFIIGGALFGGSFARVRRPKK